MKHVVTDGECMESIAANLGLEDGKTILDLPENAEYKKKRPDGTQLHPGDVLIIPELEPKTYKLETGKRHRITVKRPKRLLRIKFLDSDGSPMSGDYVVKTDDLEMKGSLDGDGVLEEKVPADVERAEVTIGDMTRVVMIGHLNPVKDANDNGITGAQARLLNLGYAPGNVDGELGPKTRAAIEAFQGANGLPATGELDQATLDKLVEAHGC
jgi:hypothetical protein